VLWVVLCCGKSDACWLFALQEETGITHVADPWGGSYFMESLTAQLESAAEALLQEVEELGGMTEALLAGGARGCWGPCCNPPAIALLRRC
jgi:hypothetical protein